SSSPHLLREDLQSSEQSARTVRGDILLQVPLLTSGRATCGLRHVFSTDFTRLCTRASSYDRGSKKVEVVARNTTRSKHQPAERSILCNACWLSDPCCR